MAKNVLLDTCYWIGLFYERDRHHKAAQKLEEYLSRHRILIPWPTMFEFVDTRLARRREDSIRFRSFVEGQNAELINDVPYRPGAMDGVFGNPRANFSLTDFMLRAMIEDVNLSVNALVTSNNKDFFDVCAKYDVELLGLE